MKFRTDKKAIPAKEIKSGVVGGHTYTLTSRYFLRDGKPYIYRMGEMHFSRVPRKDWERELKKMKQGGIDIVASYVLWNHIETDEGKFDFTGNRDIRAFIDCCEALGMPFYLRIGPWVHGEARLGGFPDWLEAKCGELRSKDERYFYYVKRFYEKIYEQVGTSKNIIGIQIENEYVEQTDYMDVLKSMLEEIGFDTEITSVTGWGNAPVPEGAVPMFGGYPEAPWAGHLNVIENGEAYGFYVHDAITDFHARYGDDTEMSYPVFTCELGGGNQCTYTRRPLIQPREVAALTVRQLGTGANGIGYYMYHGGLNPVIEKNGKVFHSFQESRESGYATDCPVISYDFQSPLGDNGQIRQSYYEIRKIMSFIKAEEEKLAPMPAYTADALPGYNDFRPLRAGVRTNGKEGYLFFLNTAHARKLEAKSDTAEISLDNETLLIPVVAPENSFGIIPFNYTIGSETVKWIKAMPIDKTEKSVTFAPIYGVEPEYMLADGTVKSLRNTDAIGGITVKLENTPHPAADYSRPLKVTPIENRLPFDVFAHIIPREGEKLKDLTKEYSVEIPENTSYLTIRAKGNLGAVFEAGDGFRLINDRYIDGDEWIADVRNVNRVIIKIQPLTDTDKDRIYYENSFVTGDFIPEVYAQGDDVFVTTPKGKTV